MKKFLPLLLALTLVLSGCQGQQTAPGDSSSDATSSDTSTSSDVRPEDSAPTPEILPDKPQVEPTTDHAQEKPKPREGGPGTLPYVDEKEALASSQTASLPDSKPLVAKYTSTAPAKQSWTKAYDTFYSGVSTNGQQSTTIKNPFSDEAVVRDGLVFPVYSYSKTFSREELLAFADFAQKQGSNGSVVEQHQKHYTRFGAVLERLDGSYYGEALGEITEGTPTFGQMMPRTQGDYTDRYSMTITEGVENQLLDRGFNPATTTARAFWIDGYTTGTFFRDGEKCCFLNQTVGIPVYDVLQSGRIYTMQELGGDIKQRIDQLAPLPVETSSCEDGPPKLRDNPPTGKPVIYLYPEQETDVSVKLDYQGTFTYTYPTYEDGWEVTAFPDGRLVNHGDNTEHYYLFWEGNKKIDWDQSHGFVVKGSDTETFLREKLTTLGLTAREMNDFITYWAPELCRNNYNLITFAYDQYEELAPLTVTPAPDTILRVHMVYRACTADTKVQPQELHPTQRDGFTVVEWGGTRA